MSRKLDFHSWRPRGKFNFIWWFFKRENTLGRLLVCKKELKGNKLKDHVYAQLTVKCWLYRFSSMSQIIQSYVKHMFMVVNTPYQLNKCTETLRKINNWWRSLSYVLTKWFELKTFVIGKKIKVDIH